MTDRVVTIITPVAPQLAEHLPATAQSVAANVRAAAEAGIDLRWNVVVDGPDDIPAHVPQFAADWTRVLRLPRQCGIAPARNIALAAAEDGWILPLDGDDLLDREALVALLTDEQALQHGWLSHNRVQTDGVRTEHWMTEPQSWPAGRLVEEWRAPLQFHPNSLLVRRDVALEVGGWPATPFNEDHLFALLLSEYTDGISTTHCPVHYRRWRAQETASRAYLQHRQVSHPFVEAAVNAARRRAGRPPVPGPTWPGTEDASTMQRSGLSP